MRGRPLAVRLGFLFAGVVVVVLLVAGIVVNRAASRSLEQELGPREQGRLELAVAFVEESLERGGGRGVGPLLQRIADDVGGQARIVGPSGEVIYATRGRDLPNETDTITAPLSEDAGGGTFELEVPSPRAPILRAFNTALIVTGAGAVAALLAAAVIVASRVTRPLRGVTEAAHRLGAGDLAARAEGGPDAESAELATAFNGMAERLERSESLRRRAASDLAHDLATPATVLESQLQAMVDGVVPTDGAELEKARASASALSSVIVQLGELTQAEAATLARHPEPIDLHALAGEVAAGLEGLARAHGIAVVSTGVTAHVVADRGQLSRALRNVVANAIQHAPPGSEVTIVTAPGTIRVVDRGPGIDDGELPFVFERFYRADRSRGRPGSGIGLTVARELVTANGGAIEVEATGPGGTTVRIDLPAV